MKRALPSIMDVTDDDESKAQPVSSNFHYNKARYGMVADKNINGWNNLHKLYYSPSTPMTLGSLARLSSVYITSRFFNIARLENLQTFFLA